MLIVTSVLQEENFIRLPDLLWQQWEVHEEYTIFLTIEKNMMKLRLDKRKGAYEVKICYGYGIIIPDAIIKSQGLRENDEISFALKNGVVTLNKGQKGYASPLSAQDRLMVKIEREMTILRKRERACDWFEEDISKYLILSDLDDKTIDELLVRPNLVEDLAFNIRDDNEFYEFFKKKIEKMLKSFAA